MSSNMKKWLSRLTPLAVAFVMCLGVGLFASQVSAEEGQSPDLIVSYGDDETAFFYDNDENSAYKGQLYCMNGDTKQYVANETVALYTAVKNTGSAENEENVFGPTVNNLLLAAGIVPDTISSDSEVSFIGNDEYAAKFTWGELFKTKRYAFPKANRPGDPGDNGQAVDSGEKDDAVEVPVLLNLANTNDDTGAMEPQVCFGQVSPSERNKPNWASKMLFTADETPTISIKSGSSFKKVENASAKNVNIPSGATVPVGTEINFGGDAASNPYKGTLYYSMTGTEPTQDDAIYNWYSYKKKYKYNPIVFDQPGTYTIQTKVFRYGNLPSDVAEFTYTVKDEADLIVSYDGNDTGFLYDEQNKQLIGGKGIVPNTTVDLYTAIKNTGSAENEENVFGPTVKDLFIASGIDPEAITSDSEVSFTGNDDYAAKFTWDELFKTTRYAFPNANRPGDPGDQGAAVTSKEKAGAVEVPVLLNLANTNDDTGKIEPQVCFGQVSPNERNKPNWASKMLFTVDTTASISIKSGSSFKKADNPSAEKVSIASGERVPLGTEVNFGGEETSSPYKGILYYTVDGSDPTHEAAIYNWYSYGKGSNKTYKYNPAVLNKVGVVTVKARAFRFGNLPSDITSFTYSVTADFVKDKAVMTINKTKVTAGVKPVVSAVTIGQQIIDKAYYTATVPSTQKVGKYNATVVGKDLCSGTITKQFTVIPAKAKIAKAKAGKKKVTVTIKSQKASGVTKYQIAYKLKSAKKWKKTTTKSTKKVIKKLKKGKKYNIKVRAYGKTGYGAYSAVKTVKIK